MAGTALLEARTAAAWGETAETRVQLLGRFRVWVRGAPIPEDAWKLRKAATLVKLLALAPERRLHREQLLEALWPDLPPAAAGHNLRVALHAALRALASGPADPHRLLDREGDLLVLCPLSPVATDVESFQACAAAARVSDEPALFHDALDLYAGDLLPEERYEECFAARRQLLRDTYQDMVDGLIHLYEWRGDLPAATAVAEEALARASSAPGGAAESQGEALYVHLMRLHALAGRRDLALRRYASLCAMLRRELDAEPRAETQALHAAIRDGRIGPSPGRRPAPRHEDTDEVPPLRIPPIFTHVDVWGRWGKRSGELDRPYGVAVDARDEVYVADNLNHRVQVFDRNGRFLRMWGGTPQGRGPGDLHGPNDVAAGPDGSIYVADYFNCRIQKFTPDGTFLLAWGRWGRRSGEFDFPASVDVDREGNVYTTEQHGERVQKFTAYGEHLWTVGGVGSEPLRFRSPFQVAAAHHGSIYVADCVNHRIQQLTYGGEYVAEWGRYGTGEGEFRYPVGVAVDPAGDVYVADGDNLRIQKFTADGRFLCKWGRYGPEPGEFRYPRFLATDSRGSLYVVDNLASCIKRFVAGPQVALRALRGRP